MQQEGLATSDPDSPYLNPHRFNANQPLSLTSIAQAVRRSCDGRETERFQPRDIRRTMKSHRLDSNADLRKEWVDVWHNHGRNADDPLPENALESALSFPVDFRLGKRSGKR